MSSLGCLSLGAITAQFLPRTASCPAYILSAPYSPAWSPLRNLSKVSRRFVSFSEVESCRQPVDDTNALLLKNVPYKYYRRYLSGANLSHLNPRQSVHWAALVSDFISDNPDSRWWTEDRGNTHDTQVRTIRYNVFRSSGKIKKSQDLSTVVR